MCADFSEDQLYIVFSSENAGYQMGFYLVSIHKHELARAFHEPFSFQYHSFEEFISAMQQITLTLAVGEEVRVVIDSTSCWW